jgi:hypothetical protein
MAIRLRLSAWRGAARQREMALRLALGATRSRLVVRLLIESILIALPGGAAGLGFSCLGVELLLQIVPQSGNSQVAVNVYPDAVVLGFTFSVSVLTGVFFGIAPALRCSRHPCGLGSGPHGEIPAIRHQCAGSADNSNGRAHYVCRCCGRLSLPCPACLEGRSDGDASIRITRMNF